MASQRAAKPPASRAVFINCPFDDGFKPIFRAMVFATLSSGYHPRCALDETDGAEIRVSKIARMIGECDWGIHDLSRVEVGPAGVPRFNMPMELGLHLGARRFGNGRHKRKRALILEAKSHRYDVALSDISGQDIEIHGNDPNEAIRLVRNWLSEHRTPSEPPLPGSIAMIGDYRLFQTEVGALLAVRRLDPLGTSRTATSSSPCAIGLRRAPRSSPEVRQPRGAPIGGGALLSGGGSPRFSGSARRGGDPRPAGSGPVE